MDKRSRGEKLFLLFLIAVGSLVLLCISGCSGSCFGCTIGCDTEDMGCVSGMGYSSEGCGTEDSCNSTFSCIDFEPPYDGESGKVLLLSCETSEDSCSGENSCYNGTFIGDCSSCGTCGVFWGSSEGYYDEEETQLGCVNGCFGCDDSNGRWSYILDNIYDLTGLE